MPWNSQLIQGANFNAAQSTADLVGAFGSNTAAGNLLLVAISWYGVTTPTFTITDTQGNAYTRVGAQQNTETDTTGGVALYYAANTIGGAKSVTVHSASNIYKTLSILEYPGLSTTTLDTSAAANGFTTLATASLTPAGTGELLIAIGTQISSGAADIFSPSTNNWTPRPALHASGNQDLYVSDQQNFSAGAYSSGFSFPVAWHWATIVAAFKNMGPTAVAGGGVCPIGSNVIIPVRGAA